MKNTLQHLIQKNKEQERAYTAQRQAEIDSPFTRDNRRDFLKKTALGGLSLTALMGLGIEDTMAETTKNVRRASAPSDLKITDLRYAHTNVMGGTAILRIDTNQGIYGLGEVRDGADPKYALMLKSRILGENPCNVVKSFNIIKQLGGQSRQAGGVCGVEMPLGDLCGRA